MSGTGAEARPIKVLAFDIDGTLTDATTWYGGDALGWMQSYSVRDGEALLRLVKRGLVVLPLSRNQTASARRRMEGLSFDTRFLGVTNKVDALASLCRDFAVDADEVCFIGDGIDDAPVFRRVGLGVAVHDAHPLAKASADVVLEADGGARVIEVLEDFLEKTGRVPVLQIDQT